MIPDPKNPYPTKEAYIVEILARSPRMAVKELHERYLQKAPKRMTLQGFYRLLSELQKRRVIIKDGKLFSIDAGWIHAVIRLGEKLNSTYLQVNPSITNILVPEGSATSFEFPTVIDMDNFWDHTLVMVTHYYGEHSHKDPNVYNYNHHCWFQMIRSQSEQTLGDTYAQMNLNWYLVAGSLSFLDSLVSGTIKGDFFHYHQSGKPIFSENTYVVVIGDYIFETSLPKYVHDMMETVYERVQALTDPGLQSIESIIRLPAKTRLTISRDTKRAEKIRLKIQACFK